MVKGLDIFKKYFADYEDQYVLIGGTACDIVFTTFIDSLAQEPFDSNSLKSYGLKNEDVIEVLQRVFS